jgi:hypothetical protein
LYSSTISSSDADKKENRKTSKPDRKEKECKIPSKTSLLEMPMPDQKVSGEIESGKHHEVLTRGVQGWG